MQPGGRPAIYSLARRELTKELARTRAAGTNGGTMEQLIYIYRREGSTQKNSPGRAPGRRSSAGCKRWYQRCTTSGAHANRERQFQKKMRLGSWWHWCFQ